ncbi:MAG: response regulator transcription factor [Rhodothermales bacterium]|nr:response regulator transcription factor [Rhodothermales bacterium]MBO6778455.1 response regulator transcription factor [Rhodothermales bacterium]
MQRLFLVDDHPIFREGLAKFILETADLTVCGMAESAPKAMELLSDCHPHLVLLDLKLRDSSGLSLLRSILDRWPHQRVLVVSMFDELQYATRLFKLGAAGYVMKDAEPEVLLTAIRTVLRGDKYASDRVKLQALDAPGLRLGPEQLSDREFEMLHLIGEGLSVDEIAGTLNLSPKTVQNHIRSAQEKMGSPNRQAFYQMARDWAGSPGR